MFAVVYSGVRWDHVIALLVAVEVSVPTAVAGLEPDSRQLSGHAGGATVVDAFQAGLPGEPGVPPDSVAPRQMCTRALAVGWGHRLELGAGEPQRRVTRRGLQTSIVARPVAPHSTKHAVTGKGACPVRRTLATGRIAVARLRAQGVPLARPWPANAFEGCATGPVSLSRWVRLGVLGAIGTGAAQGLPVHTFAAPSIAVASLRPFVIGVAGYPQGAFTRGARGWVAQSVGCTAASEMAWIAIRDGLATTMVAVARLSARGPKGVLAARLAARHRFLTVAKALEPTVAAWLTVPSSTLVK